MRVCAFEREKEESSEESEYMYKKNRTITVKCVERIDTKVEKLLPSMSLMNTNSSALKSKYVHSQLLQYKSMIFQT